MDPAQYHWHGINAVALLHRAKRDGIAHGFRPDADGIARAILESLRQADTSADPFGLATRMEALIAIGDTTSAESVALAYAAHPAADAFEFGSTLRQLEEVWNLSDHTPPGSTLLPLLRAARLKAEQGNVRLRDEAVDEELATVKQARASLEKNFGHERMSTLLWYQTGLERTKSVARVERLSGRGHGTGWLVNGADFFPNRSGVLLLTNAHVVDQKGSNGALAPDEAQANFQGLQQTLRFKSRVVWSSPPNDLDATFLELEGTTPTAAPLPLSRRGMRLTTPEPLIYIVGHPSGRDLEFSLRDNKLLEVNERLLRYRTPTEPGSSGSPVFEEHAWEVVGLHHAGGVYDRLDRNPPPYEANEGISIPAIRDRTQSSANPGGGGDHG
jgi:hypothetical protein